MSKEDILRKGSLRDNEEEFQRRLDDKNKKIEEFKGRFANLGTSLDKTPEWPKDQNLASYIEPPSHPTTSPGKKQAKKLSNAPQNNGKAKLRNSHSGASNSSALPTGGRSRNQTFNVSNQASQVKEQLGSVKKQLGSRGERLGGLGAATARLAGSSQHFRGEAAAAAGNSKKPQQKRRGTFGQLADMTLAALGFNDSQPAGENHSNSNPGSASEEVRERSTTFGKSPKPNQPTRRETTDTSSSEERIEEESAATTTSPPSKKISRRDSAAAPPLTEDSEQRASKKPASKSSLNPQEEQYFREFDASSGAAAKTRQGKEVGKRNQQNAKTQQGRDVKKGTQQNAKTTSSTTISKVKKKVRQDQDTGYQGHYNEHGFEYFTILFCLLPVCLLPGGLIFWMGLGMNMVGHRTVEKNIDSSVRARGFWVINPFRSDIEPLADDNNSNLRSTT